MNVKTWPLNSKYRTVQEVKYAVNHFYDDLNTFPALLNMNVSDFFNYVKNIPYVKDVPESEIVSRPMYLLTIFPALDCKKKSILFASFMRLKYGPGSYRFVISSNRPDGAIGHIFTQIKDQSGRWINADCTYASGKIGKAKKVTNFEIMGG